MKWPIVKLSEVTRIDRRGIDPADIVAGTKYLGLEHIESGGKILGAQIVKSGELASTKFCFTAEHILYGKLRPYLGKIALPNFSGICSTDILPIRPGERVDRRFLTYFLRLPQNVELASSRSVGVNLPRLSPTALGNFDIPLPPLADQERIVSNLDRANNIRFKREQTLAFADQFLRSAFQQFFGDLQYNPKEWDTVKLESILNGDPQNGLYRPSKDYGSGTCILRIDGFYDGYLVRDKPLKRLRIDSKTVKKYLLHNGDIVINRVNSREYLGKSTLIEGLKEDTVFESNMMRFCVEERLANPRFLVDQLQTQFVKRQILRASKDAVNQSSINQTDVGNFEVRLPPIDLQCRYADLVKKKTASDSVLHDALASASALFDSLSQRAFRGEL